MSGAIRANNRNITNGFSFDPRNSSFQQQTSYGNQRMSMDVGNRSMVIRPELMPRRNTPRFEEQDYYRSEPLGPDFRPAAYMGQTSSFGQPRIERESSLPARNTPQRREPFRTETGNYDQFYRVKPVIGVLSNSRHSTEVDGYNERSRTTGLNTTQSALEESYFRDPHQRHESTERFNNTSFHEDLSHNRKDQSEFFTPSHHYSSVMTPKPIRAININKPHFTQTTNDTLSPDKNNMDPLGERMPSYTTANLSDEKLKQEIDERINNSLNLGYSTTKSVRSTLRSGGIDFGSRGLASSSTKAMSNSRRRDHSVPVQRFNPEEPQLQENHPPLIETLTKKKFEEYKSRNFEGIPIYRARSPVRGDRSVVTQGSPVSMKKPVLGAAYLDNSIPGMVITQKHCPNCHSPVERARFYPTHSYLGDPILNTEETETNQRFETPKRGTRQSRAISAYRDSPNRSVRFDSPETNKRLTLEDFEPSERFNFNRSHETPNRAGSGKKYPIIRGPNLDYPFLIINGERPPVIERPPEVFVEKKRKKVDTVDPFLQALATTYVVKDDMKNRRKSKALMKLEESFKMNQMGDEELKGQEPLNSDQTPQGKDDSKDSQQIEKLNLFGFQSLPKGGIGSFSSMDVSPIQRRDSDQQQHSITTVDPSPLNKIKPALKQTERTGERKATVRIQDPTEDNAPKSPLLSKEDSQRPLGEKTNKMGTDVPSPGLAMRKSVTDSPHKSVTSLAVLADQPEKSNTDMETPEPPKKFERRKQHSVTEAPRKSTAGDKSASFLKKLEDMQNRSQRRLTALVTHSEKSLEEKGSMNKGIREATESDDSDTSSQENVITIVPDQGNQSVILTSSRRRKSEVPNKGNRGVPNLQFVNK